MTSAERAEIKRLQNLLYKYLAAPSPSLYSAEIKDCYIKIRQVRIGQWALQRS